MMPEWLQSMDESALWWIAEHLRTDLLTPIVKLYSSLGNKGLLFIVLALLLLCFRQTRKGGAAAGAAMIFGLLVTNITIKPLVGRLRPWEIARMSGFQNLLWEKDASFPSGHSCAAFAFAVAACIMLPKRWMKVVALVLAILMALSRLYVGVHFPSDVIAGAAVGSLCGVAGAFVVKKVIQAYQSRKTRKAEG